MKTNNKFCLTSEQERLWFEWKKNPQGHSYNTNIQFKLNGKLDKVRFEKALHVTTNFFKAFQTNFIETDNTVLQHISPINSHSYFYEDISNEDWDFELKEHLARKVITEQFHKPFNLLENCTARFCLVKLSDEEHYFIYAVPHILADGHSASMFLRALSAVYNDGEKAIISLFGSEVPIMCDYLNDKKSVKNPGYIKEAKSVWSDYLKGKELSLPFKEDVGPNRELDHAGKRAYFSLDVLQSKKLRKYARSERATVFTVLMGILGVLLYRYYKQETISLIYPVDVRTPKYKNLYGFCVNNVPLVVDMLGNPDFHTVLQRILKARRETRKYQDYPLSDMMRMLRENRQSLPSNIFNISIAQANFSSSGANFNGLESQFLPCDYAQVNNELSLLFDDSAEQIELAFDFRSSIFESSQIDTMINHFKQIIEHVIHDTHTDIRSFSLLSLAEYNKIVNEWNDSDVVLDDIKNIYGLFERQVEKTPYNVAVVCEGQTITYEQLNKRANFIAKKLLDEGLRKEDVVGVCMNRSIELIVSLLAVLKAGGAYLPLDPGYPMDRLGYMVKDSNTRLILTDSSLNNSLIKDGIKPIFVDNEKGVLEGNIDSEVQGNNLAYVIYTSGSTGRPKGSMIEHKGVCSLVKWAQSNFMLTETDAFMQNVSFSFDPSVYEIFWPLTCGARLVLPLTQQSKDVNYLIQCINHNNVTITTLITSMLDVFLNRINKNDCHSLRYVITGGEAVTPKMNKRFYESHLHAKLCNFYGPTETTVVASYTTLKPEDTLITIGKPIDNTKIYILNEQMQPQPIGVVGEIYIGGIGVSRGYLNNPEMTKDKFVRSPFNNNEILYRTYDLAYFLADGSICFSGRSDDQIKIRGFRVELKEIEVAIMEHPQVQNAVVKRHKNNHNQLVAYITSVEGEVSHSQLVARLQQSLPDYMIPSYFVDIATIPLTVNNKVDYASLPEPEMVLKVSNEYVAPTNNTEMQVCRIWAALLKREVSSISIDDNFFYIGGDSLLALELVVQLQKIYHRNIQVTSLFQYPTVRQFVSHMNESAEDEISLLQQHVSRRLTMQQRVFS